MTTISIIGSGNMATAIGTRAAKHGHTVKIMSRNTAKAQRSSTSSATEPPSARTAPGRRGTSSSWRSCTPVVSTW